MTDKIVIYTENPEKEMWQRLSRYIYKSQIKKYYDDNGVNYNGNLDELSNIVSNAITQAKEYFDLSRESSLNISPLLLYYGTINLILAISVLKSGEKIKIENHGMNIKINSTELMVGLQKIHFFNPKTGGVHVFLNKLDNDLSLIGCEDWTIKEIFLSIPEINQEAIDCYGIEENYCYALEQSISENGLVTKINFRNEEKGKIEKILMSIPLYKSNYLPPQIKKIDDNYFAIINKKLFSEDISIESCFGQSFFTAGHKKGNKNIVLPQWAYMYIALFGLCSLCRYYPENWNPFIKLDESGEKLLIEKFLDIVRRKLPNIFLSYLLNKTIIFENDRYQIENKSKRLTEHEIKDLINVEMSKIFKGK